MARAIRKAVFPVAGLGTRFLPATKAMPKEMLPVVDRPLIQYAVDEARAAGAPHSRAILKVEAQYQPGQSLIGAIPIQMAVCSMILIARQSPRPLHRHFHHLWLFITFGTGLQEFSHVWLLFDFHENTKTNL